MGILKVLHVLFVFSWIGALLMLTRLLAYHVKEPPEAQERLARIYLRTYRFVDLPSMCLAVLFGIILLILTPIDFTAGWFHMKLTFAVLLIVCDILIAISIYKVSQGPVSGNGIYYKMLHGCTALFLILVLVSIYIIRHKEQEIITRYEQGQEITQSPEF